MFNRRASNSNDAPTVMGDSKVSATGLPRFEPQPGGFGRRTTPVGSAIPAKEATLVANAPASVPVRETEVVPASSPATREAPEAASAPKGDLPTRIADWLMRELRNERGLHCETLLTAAGSLTGFSAQQALWEGMVVPGKMAIAQAFRVVETRAGENFFFGDPLDNLLFSVEAKHQSVWKIVATDALAGAGEHLPDVGNLLRHVEASAGTLQFGLPRLPDEHLPNMLPRQALERFWPGCRMLLTLSEPLTWPLHMAYATKKLTSAMKNAILPDLAVRIVFEAAVPMSRVDPKTVPND